MGKQCADLLQRVEEQPADTRRLSPVVAATFRWVAESALVLRRSQQLDRLPVALARVVASRAARGGNAARSGRVLRAQFDGLKETLFQVRAEQSWPQGSSIREFLVPCLARKASWWAEMLARFSDPAWRRAVVSAPFAAAFAAECCERPSMLTLYELDRARQFERNWFDDAYRIALTILLGERIAAARVPQQPKGNA
jgi:hypothetical protein